MSFIQWPTLFGSTYILPAAVIIVLLLALLLLSSSRRRRKTERARMAPERAIVLPEDPSEDYAGDTAGQAGQEFGHTPSIVTQSLTMSAQPVDAMAPAGLSAQTAPLTAAFSLAPAPDQPLHMPLPDSFARPEALPEALPETLPPADEFALPPDDEFALPPDDEFGPDTLGTDFPEFETTERRSKRARKPERPPRATAGGPAGLAAAVMDPLNETITDILSGWGDLTIEDKKRIELFRAAPTIAALAAFQLPKSKSEDMKSRLDQLRRYAIDMERREQGGPGAAAITAAMAAVEAEPPALAGAVGPLAPETAAIAQAAPPVIALVAPSLPPTDGRSFFDDGAPAPELAVTPPDAAPTFSFDASYPAAESAGASPSTAAAAAEQTPARPQGASGLDTKDAEWASPRPLWEPDADEEEFEVLPAPAYDEIEMGSGARAQPVAGPSGPMSASLHDPETEATASPFGSHADGAEEPTFEDLDEQEYLEDIPTQAPVHIVMGAPMPEATAVPRTALDLGDIFWEDETGEPLTRLGIRVETADQLLALPPSERADMTAFLPPAELAATFRATQDLDLKKAVIDTLEHIGSPASLNALGTCFEDKDPGIQVYALAAADRLLGVL